MPGMANSNTALPLSSCIGFNGSVGGGLVLEKDGTTVIYPLGSTIIVRQLYNDQQQTFLQGHTDEARLSRRTYPPAIPSSSTVTQLAAGLLPCTVTLWAVSGIGAAEFHGFKGRYHHLGSDNHDFAAPHEPSQGKGHGCQEHLMLVCPKAACTACCVKCRSKSRLWPFHAMSSFLPHSEVRMTMHW